MTTLHAEHLNHFAPPARSRLSLGGASCHLCSCFFLKFNLR